MVRLRSPTLWLLVLTAAVYGAQLLLSPLYPVTALLSLSLPFAAQPWTVVTSVFAHGSPAHLLTNLVGIAVAGVLVERRTTPVRFLVFAVGAGAVAGVAEVSVADLLGQQVAVLGASGTVFALVGYVLTGNRLTSAAVGGVNLGATAQLVVFGAVAAAIVVLTGGRGVAHVAHFVGLLIGLLAGRAHLLRPG